MSHQSCMNCQRRTSPRNSWVLAGGPGTIQECRKMGGSPTGSAVVTSETVMTHMEETYQPARGHVCLVQSERPCGLRASFDEVAGRVGPGWLSEGIPPPSQLVQL